MDAAPDRYELGTTLGSNAASGWSWRGSLVHSGAGQYIGFGDLQARDHDFVLVTNDLDFPRILAHTLQAKPSVILLRGEPLVPEVRGEALLYAIAECSVELNSGAILTIDWLDRPRARILPLK